MLYTGLWIATVIIFIWGDFTAVPSDFADEPQNLFLAWGGLSFLCPPLALLSVRMIQSPDGKKKYRGLWLRMAADIGQFTALIIYTILRLNLGDYHVYPMAGMLTCVLFVGHLVMRDIKRIFFVEKLAIRIQRESLDG